MTVLDQLWNAMIGFQQVHGMQTISDLTDYLLDQTQIVAYERLEYEPNVFYILEHDMKFVGFNDGQFFLPDGSNRTYIQHLEHHHGIQIKFPTLNPNQFAEHIKEKKQGKKTVHYVLFEFYATFFTLKYQFTTSYITLIGNVGCLDFQLNFETKEAGVDGLLLVQKPNIQCKLSKPTKFGPWLLRWIDVINQLCDMEVCRLADASKFGGISAACLYSATHNGLSWYMSHHYLMDTFYLETSIRETNQMIASWTNFWNQIDPHRQITSHVCKNIPMEEFSMVKYYKTPVFIYRPKNAYCPAVFYQNGDIFNSKRQERIDSRISIQDILEGYRFSSSIPIPQMNHQFMFFRQRDILSILPNSIFTEDDFVSFSSLDACKPTFHKRDQIDFNLITMPTQRLINNQTIDWETYYTELNGYLEECHSRKRLRKNQVQRVYCSDWMNMLQQCDPEINSPLDLQLIGEITKWIVIWTSAMEIVGRAVTQNLSKDHVLVSFVFDVPITSEIEKVALFWEEQELALCCNVFNMDDEKHGTLSLVFSG